MVDDRIGKVSEDEVDDMADDVIYLDDAETYEADDVTESVWASIVTGAHYAFRRSFGSRGRADGTGAG